MTAPIFMAAPPEVHSASAEQRPRPGLPARCRAGVEFVERHLHRDRRRADGGLGSRAGRDVGRPELRSLRRRTRAVSGVADPGQRRQRRDCRSTGSRRDGLHHRAGRHADTARAGRQPRHPRCAAGDEFPWHQHDSDRPERGRLRADVGPGRHRDGHLSNHRRRGGRSVAADHRRHRRSSKRIATASAASTSSLPPDTGATMDGLAAADRLHRFLQQRLAAVDRPISTTTPT